MGWRSLLALGAVLWVLFVLVRAPADRLLVLAGSLPGARVEGVRGSLWAGGAERIEARGLVFEQPRWQIRPARLLLGRLAFDIEARFAGRPASVRAVRGLGGAWLEQVRFSMPAAGLARLAPRAGRIDLAGELVADLERVRLSGAGVPLVSGSLRWSDARLERPLQLELGSVSLVLREAGQASVGQLVAEGGSLLVNADVELRDSGDWRLDALIRPRGPLPEPVQQFLDTFAEAGDGQYRLEWNDSLL